MRYASVAMLILAGWAALKPAPMAWVYIAAVMAFEAWLLRRMRAEERGPVAVGEPPYRFTAEEAELIGRYRFYFTYPALAAQAGSVLAAIGLSAMVLALWLTFRQAYVPGAIVGLDLFAVGWFTRRVAPVHVLRLAASRGKRDALRILEILDPLWAKINAANQG
ncbi:MAG: hypothetical protein EPO20_18435 [Betaproteobacteria bacterium]|nr:MAG: hypothetical protein EPO20_18435 [Betaproteobacteria bacterium]